MDLVDFAEGVSDEAAGRRLARAIRGKGAFRRFQDKLHEEYPELVSLWHTFRDVRATRRAVDDYPWDVVVAICSCPDPARCSRPSPPT